MNNPYRNLNPKILNPYAREIGINTVRTNLTIKLSSKAMAKIIGKGNMSAGVDMAIEAVGGVIAVFQESLKTIETARLKSLSFAIESLPLMLRHILGNIDRPGQKAIDIELAETLFSLIEKELNCRGEGDLPYKISDIPFDEPCPRI